jgi:hypothetical protein
MRDAALIGQDTLLSCWRALGDTGFGPGRLVETPHATAAVFPDVAYFNNAILTSDIEPIEAAASVDGVYAEAGITTWALWVPSPTAAFEGAPDRWRQYHDPLLTRGPAETVLSAVARQRGRPGRRASSRASASSNWGRKPSGSTPGPARCSGQGDDVGSRPEGVGRSSPGVAR